MAFCYLLFIFTALFVLSHHSMVHEVCLKLLRTADKSCAQDQTDVYNLPFCQMLADKGHRHTPCMDQCGRVTGAVW